MSRFKISNVMMSNDPNRDLYRLREFDSCPNVADEFYGEIILWLSYEQLDGSIITNYWETEDARDYIHPNFINPNISEISTSAAKVSTRGLCARYGETNTISFEYDERMSRYVSFAKIGRIGTWFRYTTPVGTPSISLSFLAPDSGPRNGFVINQNVLYLLYGTTQVNTGWTCSNNVWYFIEFEYNLDINRGVLYVSTDDSQNIFTFTRNNLPVWTSQTEYFNISLTGGVPETAGMVALDNTILSTNPTKSLYSIRNMTSCPKGEVMA